MPRLRTLNRGFRPISTSPHTRTAGRSSQNRTFTNTGSYSKWKNRPANAAPDDDQSMLAEFLSPDEGCGIEAIAAKNQARCMSTTIHAGLLFVALVMNFSSGNLS